MPQPQSAADEIGQCGYRSDGELFEGPIRNVVGSWCIPHVGPSYKLLDIRRSGVWRIMSSWGAVSNLRTLRWMRSMSSRSVFSMFGLHWRFMQSVKASVLSSGVYTRPFSLWSRSEGVDLLHKIFVIPHRSVESSPGWRILTSQHSLPWCTTDPFT